MASFFRTKEEALQKLRTIWVMYFMTIALYAYAGELTRFRWLGFTYAPEIFSALAILNVLSILRTRQKLFLPALQNLASQPDNAAAIRRWYASQVVLLTSAESVPLFGLALRLGGNTLNHVLPFYFGGVILLLLLFPRQIPTPATFNT